MQGLLYALTMGRQRRLRVSGRFSLETASEPAAHRTLLVFCSVLLGFGSCPTCSGAFCCPLWVCSSPFCGQALSLMYLDAVGL